MVTKIFRRDTHLVQTLEGSIPILAEIPFDIHADEEVRVFNWEQLSVATQTLITTKLAEEGLTSTE